MRWIRRRIRSRDWSASTIKQVRPGAVVACATAARPTHSLTPAGRVVAKASCSGLIFAASCSAGRAVPRSSSMQRWCSASEPSLAGLQVGQERVGDRQLGGPAATRGRDRMRDLVPPGLRAAFVAPFACGAHERDPDVVDAKGVLAQRSFRLRRPDEPSARLGARAGRLDGVRAVFGEEPQRMGAGALRAIDEPSLGEESEDPSCPAQSCLWCVERVELAACSADGAGRGRRGLLSRPRAAAGRLPARGAHCSPPIAASGGGAVHGSSESSRGRR